MFINVIKRPYGMIAKYVMTYAELELTGLAHDFVIENDDDDDAPGDQIQCYASECHDVSRQQLAHFGLTWDDEARCVTLTTSWDPDDRTKYVEFALGGCRSYTAFVNACYEYSSPDNTTWGPLLDFGGDDDVDYNGSYLDIIIDCVELHLTYRAGDCLIQNA